MGHSGILLGVLTATVFALATIPASADINAGLAAYHDGDYETALENFLPEAENGNLQAQTALGIMYQSGRGVKRDLVKAKQWYEKAVEKGDPIAQNNLGYMYWKGQGVSRNTTHAAKLFGLATIKGYSLSAYHLADMYSKGDGVEKNLLRAYVLYVFSMDNLNTRQKGEAEMRRQGIAKTLSEKELLMADTYLEALRNARDDPATGTSSGPTVTP